MFGNKIGILIQNDHHDIVKYAGKNRYAPLTHIDHQQMLPQALSERNAATLLFACRILMRKFLMRVLPRWPCGIRCPCSAGVPAARLVTVSYLAI